MEEDRIKLTPAELRAQKRRSVAIAMVLVALIVVFYIVTVIRMGS